MCHGCADAFTSVTASPSLLLCPGDRVSEQEPTETVERAGPASLHCVVIGKLRNGDMRSSPTQIG